MNSSLAWELFNESSTDLQEAKNLLKEALEFLNRVPNRLYGDNYKLCSKISKYLKKSDEKK